MSAASGAGDLFVGRLVRLRPYEPGDLETMARHLRDTEISRRDSEIMWPHQRAAVERHVDEMGRAAPGSDDRSLAVETLDGRLVGGLSVFRTSRRNGTFCVGLGIAERTEWGKGYATEAILLALRFVFHELRYQKCDLEVYAFNNRALRLYRRLGFVEEGIRRLGVFTAGRHHDVVLLGMTREEFDERHAEWRLEPGAGE